MKEKKPVKMGRPTKYKPEYVQEILDFFDVDATKVITETYTYKDGAKKETPVIVANDLPTIVGFCRKLKIAKHTLLSWTEKYPDFLHSYTRAKELQEDIWKQNGLRGLYNSQFAQFLGKNCFGYKDKTEVEVGITNWSALVKDAIGE